MAADLPEGVKSVERAGWTSSELVSAIRQAAQAVVGEECEVMVGFHPSPDTSVTAGEVYVSLNRRRLNGLQPATAATAD